MISATGRTLSMRPATCPVSATPDLQPRSCEKEEQEEEEDEEADEEEADADADEAMVVAHFLPHRLRHIKP